MTVYHMKIENPNHGAGPQARHSMTGVSRRACGVLVTNVACTPAGPIENIGDDSFVTALLIQRHLER